MLTAFEIEALLLSFKVAIVAVVVGLPIAVAVAYQLAHRTFVGKTAVEALINTPLVVPPVVVGYGLLLVFSPTTTSGAWLTQFGLSPAFTWKAAALASGIMAFPLMVRAVRQAFEAEDGLLADAARSLGAGPAYRFFKLSLPLATPGLISAGVLGFARAIGEFGATITFAANIPGLTQTLPLALYSAVQAPGGEEAGLRLALISLIPAVASLVIAARIEARIKKHRGAKANSHV